MVETDATLDFTKLDGLLPAVVQHHESGQVLMVGFMNQEAWSRSLQSRLVTFYSRTRNRLWTKGETSGDVLRIKRILLDCDGDTVLVMADPAGPTCHTGAVSCFFREISLA
ncbi:MAG: phosphoribosyl-AMP cyclohydrolase [Chloroflexi bacterium]|nr:phosphoribosyl-AMP cyclohydrolase [Chloroflexota bacterium]